MSTRAIRALAQWVKAEYGGHIEVMADKALTEVQAIERAAKAYQRPMAADRTEWLEMVKTMSSIAKDEP